MDSQHTLRRTKIAATLACAVLGWLAGASTLAAQDSPAPTPVSAAPDAAYVQGIWHDYQTWNNCGPATLTMGLSYWGWWGDQAVAATYLKPRSDDKNVSPAEMVAFVNREVEEANAVYRYAGDLDLLKRLVAAGFPVIIETGFEPEDLDWMGHYRLIVGYSERQATFATFDSYQGADILVSYDELDAVWQHFNRVYVVVYAPDREAEVAGLLGADWDPARNRMHALKVAQVETGAAPDNPFARFNLGTSYVLNEQYDDAARAFDEARRLGLPWRMLWYQFGPLEAYLHVNRLDDVVALAETVVAHTPYVEEMHYYLGMVHMQRGEYDSAQHLFQRALYYNHHYARAQSALNQLATMQ